jgi:hypothetical protein
MRSPWPSERVIGWLLPVFAILAEGALLTVVYVAVTVTIDRQAPLLGVFEFSAAAAIAALVVRRRWFDPDADVGRFMALVGALGAIGWLWDEAARTLVLAGNPVDALAHHPGGWLLLVAGMRGIGRAFGIDDRAMTQLVMIGVPSLAIPWGLGQLAQPDLRPVFADAAFVASLTFVASGFIAAGLARLQEIGRETGVDWRRNRSWLGTVFGVIVVVLAIGIPAAALLGLPADAIVRGLIGPLLALIGWILFGFAVVAALVFALLARLVELLGIELPPPVPPEELTFLQNAPAYTLEQLRGALTGLGVFWIAVLVLFIIVARIWIRHRSRAVRRGTNEERSFQLPDRSTRVRRSRAPRLPRRVRRGEPRDAVTAYLAALDDVAAADPSAARAEAETPRAHARRVAVGSELVALQADYALARYAQRDLTPAEHRRALGRRRRLRDRLRGLH